MTPFFRSHAQSGGRKHGGRELRPALTTGGTEAPPA